MAVNSRRKGKNGELEACHTLAELFGWHAHRSQQYKGSDKSDDILVQETPGIFWEIKRCRALNLPKTLQKAISECGRKCPVVMHRTDRSPVGWLITIRLTDLPRLVHAYEISQNVALAPVSLPDPDACNHPGHSQEP